MSNFFHIEREAIYLAIKLASNLKNPKKSIPLSQELRLNIDEDKSHLIVTTHRELKPATFSSRIPIFNEKKSSLDITLSVKAIQKQLEKMKDSKYIKITTENKYIKIQPANYGGDLFKDSDDNFYDFERPVENKVFTNQTHLLTDYIGVEPYESDAVFPVRKSTHSIIESVFALASEARTPTDIRVRFICSEESLSIELFSIDSYAHLNLSVADSFSESKLDIDYDSLKLLKKTNDLLFKFGFCSVNLTILNNSSLVIRCGSFECKIDMPVEEKYYEIPKSINSKLGWIEYSNNKLLSLLNELDIAPTPADDKVEIKIIDNKICAQVVTEINSANYQLPELKGHYSDVQGVMLNRKQLTIALRNFNEYDLLKIHGLKSTSSMVSIKSVNNISNVVMISITDIL